MLLLFTAIYKWYIKKLQKQGSSGKLKSPYCSLKGTKTSMMWSSTFKRFLGARNTGWYQLGPVSFPVTVLIGRGEFYKSNFKLINYSCSQKPINDDHLGYVDEFWYLMKHQIKHHQVFIWNETCFSSEIKHLHFNEMFYWLTQLMETMQYQRKHVTA